MPLLLAELNNHHHNQFENMSSPLKETPVPIRSHSIFLQTLCPRQQIIYFSSFYIFLFWTCPVNGIIHVPFVTAFCSLRIMFLMFIHVVTCFSISFLFIAKQYFIIWIDHILFMHASVHGRRVVSAFWLLWIILLWTFIYKFFVWTYAFIYLFILET